MQAPQKKKFPGKYDPQLKLAIARDYFTSNLGYGSLAKKYDVPEGTVPSISNGIKRSMAMMLKAPQRQLHQSNLYQQSAAEN